MEEVTNGGLSSPVFSGSTITFQMSCTKCATPIGVLVAEDVPAPARVFLKGLFAKQRGGIMPSLVCPVCYSTK